MDWDALWENRKKGMLSLAVSCGTCYTTAATCECAKRDWINREKERRGLPHDKAYHCDFCNQMVTHVWLRYGRWNICETCLDEGK